MTPLDAAQPASLKRDGDAALFADSEASDDLPLVRVWHALASHLDCAHLICGSTFCYQPMASCQDMIPWMCSQDLISQKRAGMTPLPEAKKRDADKELFSDATAMLGQLSSADLNDCYAPMEWNTPKKPSLASTHRLWTGKPLVRHDVSSASMADCYQVRTKLRMYVFISPQVGKVILLSSVFALFCLCCAIGHRGSPAVVPRQKGLCAHPSEFTLPMSPAQPLLL